MATYTMEDDVKASPFPDASTSSSLNYNFLTTNSVSALFTDAYNKFASFRASFGLENPGTVENVSREVTKDVFLNQVAFTGLRADLTRGLSLNPVFQTTHNLCMGSQGMAPYTFSALFGDNKTFLHANLDNEGQLGARFNYQLGGSLVTRVNCQLAPGQQSLLQWDLEHTGADSTTTLKSFNPSILDGSLSGIFIGSHLQSISPKLSLGLEAVWQKQGFQTPSEMLLSYVARYNAKEWIASGQLQAQGGLQATYWRRLSDKVEAGVETHLTFGGLARGGGGLLGAGPSKEGVTTVGAKYEFRSSVFRAQLDSHGKVGAWLERRVAPAVMLTFSAEMDHFKNNAKVGFGVSVEAAPDELMEQMQSQGAPGIQPPA